MRRAIGLLLLTCCGVDATARVRIPSRRGAGFTVRRRMFTSPLITDPGSVNIWLAGAIDTNSSYLIPMQVAYTPSNWRTELSFGGDLVASQVDTVNGRTTQFSEYLNFAATTAFKAGDNFNWAFAPLVSFVLRGDDRTRIGATVYARYDYKADTLSSSLSWSGATTASGAHPYAFFDATTGYARRFGKWTAYVSGQWERASTVPWLVSVFAGVQFDLNDHISFDFSGQHYNLNFAPIDHQIVAGVNWTFSPRP